MRRGCEHRELQIQIRTGVEMERRQFFKNSAIAGASPAFSGTKVWAKVQGMNILFMSRCVISPLRKYGFVFLLTAMSASLWASSALATHAASPLAPTPPMGWNSWDSYGAAVTEPEVKSVADTMSKQLKQYGWQYVVVDIEWYAPHPPRGSHYPAGAEVTMDAYGRLLPATNRFPSAANGAGFRALADYVHARGLKFGIHIMRGIPRQAVEENTPILGSSLHAADIADKKHICTWNPDMYGIDMSKPGAQQYYDSIVALYASWGVDFIKADDMAPPFEQRRPEWEALHKAILKTGRPTVLSLSGVFSLSGPGPSGVARSLRQNAQMWRISNDIWDLWHSTVPYPQGLGDQFPRVAQWAGLAEPGHWPDADMLPLGSLGPTPGLGEPRQTRLTHDEQRTLMTLWTIARSPLMFGGDLAGNSLDNDPWTKSLLTNPEVLAIDQHSRNNHPAYAQGPIHSWIADSATPAKLKYLAVFNLGDEAANLSLDWSSFGISWKAVQVLDLWQRSTLGTKTKLSVTIPAHGCVYYTLTPISSGK
jgi:alpha-galactosidase